jgi:hypothetical protein
MGYSAYGAMAAVGFVAIVSAVTSADRGMNYEAAKGSVYLIDRTCNFVETTTSPDGRKTARGVKDSCISSDEWATIRAKRDKVVSGKAVVHVSYIAPQDGSSRTAELKFDGRDDAFYDLKAGDQIDILVSNDDPAKIIEG